MTSVWFASGFSGLLLVARFFSGLSLINLLVVNLSSFTVMVDYDLPLSQGEVEGPVTDIPSLLLIQTLAVYFGVNDFTQTESEFCLNAYDLILFLSL